MQGDIEGRVAVLGALLDQWGYSSSYIEREFPVNLSVREQRVADVVAFTDSKIHDASTATLIAEFSDTTRRNELSLLHSMATMLAAPLALTVDHSNVSVWAIRADVNALQRLEQVPIGEVGQLSDRRSAYGREVLRRPKDHGLSQAALFPLDAGELMHVSRRKSREILTSAVEDLVASAASLLPDAVPTSITRLALAAIAVSMLRDKRILPEAQTGGALIDAAIQRFPGYFDWTVAMPSHEFELFNALVDQLASSLSFAGLEPAMVSDVYEEALVSPTQRRVQGTFYTPPGLARQMAAALPVESFPPAERHILDPTCGSGTMLLAGAERLRHALLADSATSDIASAHQYVTGHLAGFDNDPFAVEISKLSLLLAALPAGNSWRVQTADVLSMPPDNAGAPSMIISNPPWSQTRAQGYRVERANLFVSWMLEAVRPGGYVACVLPLGWAEAASNRSARQELLAQARLLDLWYLPTEVFPTVSDAIAPIVVVAQKSRHTIRRPTLIKTVRRAENLASFYELGTPESAILVDANESADALLQGPITSFLTQRGLTAGSIANIAVVRNGRPHKPGRPRRTANDASHWELTSLRDLPAFGRAIAKTPVRFPEDFDNTGPAWAKYVQPPKLVVTAKRWSTGDPWRFKVGFDDSGAVLRETFHLIVPKDDHRWGDLPATDRLPALMALLGSALANCWVGEHSRGRNLSPRSFDSLPLPPADGWHRLANMGKALLGVAQSGSDDEMSRLCSELEALVADIYQVPAGIQEEMKSILGGSIAPEGTERFPAPSLSVFYDETTELPTFGEVLEVSPNMGLRVWVSGMTADEGEWIAVPKRAHGWLMAQGQDFSVQPYGTGIEKAIFSLHPSEWRLPSEVSTSELQE
ncbi:N-6 DNA methylase [Aquipuribacter sp. SD81]|uniref:N-6 DNA methylase n=1 Tax=Aquipuribacter sp. SD81 TaxID=3127703 RepID=UPI00301A19A4